MKKTTFFVIVALVAVMMSLLWNGIGFVIMLALTGGTVLWKLLPRRSVKPEQTELEQYVAKGFTWLLCTAVSFLLIFLMVAWLGEAGIAVICALLFAAIIVCLDKPSYSNSKKGDYL